MDVQAVCQFGKTKYDSRILDSLYRVWGTEDGGTVLSAYWNDDLKSFKIQVPYLIIKELINGSQIGALCGNYDWIETELDGTTRKTLSAEDIKKAIANVPMYSVPSNKFCIDLASNVAYSNIDDLINNAERIKEYCKQMI